MNKTMETIAGLGRGKCEEQVEKSVKKLIAAVRKSGKSGKISIDVGVSLLKPGQTGQIIMGFELKENKIPRQDMPMSVFHVDDELTLHDNDPNQLSMGPAFEVGDDEQVEATEVMDKTTGEFKEVK